MANVTTFGDNDERTFLRINCDEPMRVTCQGGVTGHAHSQDVGRGGIRIEFARYLRPGRHVMITTARGEELKAQVVWCRPKVGTDRFVAGVRILHDELSAYDTMSQMIYEALRDQHVANPATSDRAQGWAKLHAARHVAAHLSSATAAAAPFITQHVVQ